MFALQILLYPFAVLYDAITTVRNKLYDQGKKPSISFDVPVIGVGNLSVGGTGKTPMIEHLIRSFSDRFQIATLSRGYKRKTKGFRLATSEDSALTLGDEPFQFFRKFGKEVTVAVGEDRALAIPMILQEHENVNLILLDDAFQHRRVKPTFQILLTEFRSPFYKDYLLPVGRLRESKQNASRADVVVVTKCPPHLSVEEQMKIESAIRVYTEKPVFFTTLRYGELLSISSNAQQERDVILVTGIANAESLKSHVKASFNLVEHFDFADHHQYTEQDVQKIAAQALNHRAMVITTEKDAVKLESPVLNQWLSEIPCFYLPIEIEFLKNGKEFDEMILNAVTHA